MIGHMIVPSIPIANTDAKENAEEKEEGTGMTSFSNLKCSIVEVVDMDDNRVGAVVTNSDMLVGL